MYNIVHIYTILYIIVQTNIINKGIMMSNRGIIKTTKIAEKLKQVETNLGLSKNDGFEKVIASSPLLFINGRLDRKGCKYIAKNFSMPEKLNDEIKNICKGSDLTILNYLIYRGLESIKQSKQFISIEYDELELEFK